MLSQRLVRGQNVQIKKIAKTRSGDRENQRDRDDERRGGNRNRRGRYRDRDRGRGRGAQDEAEPEVSEDDVLIPVCRYLGRAR